MIKVRIQNFQSIKDAELEIDGFTVITGPNNSGKSAVMRAVRGVFTNAPAGPLVRNGAKHLTVSIAFPDGTDLKWEKGGKVNRYTLNGKELNSVGRGVPPEVAALGVGEIKAASDRLWPQIAEQFTGSLFLVNRPGSVVAEALSDVERVGKLTEALRLSESDRRSCASELKVRRKDLNTHREEAALYEGLEEVLDVVNSLEDRQKEIHQEELDLSDLAGLDFQRTQSQSEIEYFEGFDPSTVPTSEEVDALTDLGVRVAKATQLSKSHNKAKKDVQITEGFDAVELPATEDVKVARTAWKEANQLHHRLEATQRDASQYKDEVPDFPTTKGVEKLQATLQEVGGYEDRIKSAADEVARLDIKTEEVQTQLEEAQHEVAMLLGSRGVCPTCGAVCSVEHKVAAGGGA